MTCPDLVGLLPTGGFLDRMDGSGNLWHASSGTWRSFSYPDLALLDTQAFGGTASWCIDPTDDAIYHTNGTDLYRSHPDTGAVLLANLYEIDGIIAGNNLPMAYSPTDQKLYTLADGGWELGGPPVDSYRLVRLAMDGTFEATVYEFDPALYDPTVSSPGALEVIDGLIYGTLKKATSNNKFPFVYDIAAGTTAIGVQNYGLGWGGVTNCRGVHHEGWGFYNTQANTYVRILPDATSEPLACEDLDNSLSNISGNSFMFSRDGLGRTILHVVYNTGSGLEQRIYEWVAPSEGLDIPTLDLPPFSVPFRAIDGAIRRDLA